MSDLLSQTTDNGRRQLMETGVTADISTASTGVVSATAVTFAKPFAATPKILVTCTVGTSAPSTAVFIPYVSAASATAFTPSILVVTAEASDNVKLNWMAVGNPATAV